MELALLQRKLVGLIKGSYQPAHDDPAYIRAVAGSEHLAVVRDVVHWWRAFGVGRFCVLTATLLKQRGLFDDAIRAFVSNGRVSPFIEESGPAFLEAMSTHADHLVRSLARFELALLSVKQGDPREFVVEWDHDPGAVLDAVLNGLPLSGDPAGGSFRTTLSRGIPGMFRTEAVPAGATALARSATA
jgi:hypothetical protein